MLTSLQCISPPTKPLYIHLVDADTLIDPEGVSAFGLFMSNDTHSRMYLASRVPLYAMEQIVFHEWAHYEQWRDGRKLQERGMNVRAKNLCKAMKALDR